MDFNIGAAFWFASRGTGWLYHNAPQLTVARPERAHDDLVRTMEPQDATVCTGPEINGGPTCSAPGGRTIPDAKTILEAAAVVDAEEKEKLAAGILQKGETKSPACNGNDVGNLVGGNGKLKKAAKMNKNMDELCPVEGCRRLLRPGCIFGLCSRCCLKVQGLLDAAGSRCSASSPETRPAAAVARDKQGLFKARAAAEALRALEDHLTEYFEDLQTPFRVEALATLLRRDDETCRVRSGRDIHYRSPGSTSGGRQPIKLCPIHKSRSREATECKSGRPTPCGRKLGTGEKWLAGRSVSATMFTSAARVLLVSACTVD